VSQQQWVTVATAPDQAIAEMWAEILKESGLDATVSPEDAVSFLGVSPRPVRVIVPESQAAAARSVLADFVDDDATEGEPG
jgi:hypothetical protein